MVGPSFVVAVRAQALIALAAGDWVQEPGIVPLLGGHAVGSGSVVQASVATDPANHAILVASVFAVVVVAAIAISQRRDLARYRNAERALMQEQAQIERLRASRHAHRKSWEAVFQELQDPLVKLRDIEHEVRAQGPLNRDVIDAAELGRLQQRLENVSARCPDRLRDPLRAVAAAVRDLRGIAIPSDADITDEHDEAVASAAPGGKTPEIAARSIGVMAIEQYKAATDLHAVIGKAWDAVHHERGAEA